VQSQANRLEETLLKAFDAGQCTLPILSVTIPNHGRITALDAPHRVSDAIFRDSLYRDTERDALQPFHQSVVGMRIVNARVNNATAFFETCPTALIFGTWDSHSGRGIQAARIQRALTSEIIGLNAVSGCRTGSRIDPLGIERNAARIYQHEADYWTLEPDQARRNDKGEPLPFGDGRPSEIGHGNVTPTISLPGGVTISEAVQTTVLSFIQLRRLRFPDDNGRSVPARDIAGRAVLAALALYAIVLQREEGYDLRSRCLLLPTEPTTFEFVGPTTTDIAQFMIGSRTANELFNSAYERSAAAGLGWQAGSIELTPSEKLLELVGRSDAITEPSEEKSHARV
jgi:CRISPR-associated protein Csb1